MKAAVIRNFGHPDVINIEDIDEPVIEKPDEIKVRVIGSSINPVDWKIRKGNHKYTLGSGFPIVLGFDCCGEVVETGADVTKFAPGNIVYGRLDRKFGRALAEFAVASEKVFALKPDIISTDEAAATPLAASTALQALRDKGEITKEKTILINGASGGVGVFAVQFARLLGKECTAVNSSRHNDLIEQLGAHHIIDYTKTDLLNIGKRYDIIFDVIGNYSFLKCRKLLNKGGIYVTSLPRPKILIHKLVALFTSKKVRTLLMKPIGSDLEYMNQLFESGKLKVVIDEIFKLEDISDAHGYSQSGKAQGKIVIRVS